MPGLPSLFQISQATCIKLAGRITDVGDTPYHLVRPILKRLNAKQLANLETNSPTVTPLSDELWGELIEKDFPDRPFNPAKLRFLASGENTDMPRKALYKQYASEREQFLATSADRLRRMTEKLRKEKLKNSITKVPGVLADPSIRRRVPQNTHSRSFSAMKTRPQTILGKAIKDVLHRLLMFGPPLRSYDPYKPFQAPKPVRMSEDRVSSPSKSPIRASRNLETSPSKRESVRNEPLMLKTRECVPVSAQGLRPVRSSEEQEKQTEAAEKTPKEGADVAEQVSNLQPQPLRKRRPPPSIFLNQRKKQRPGVPVSSPRETRGDARGDTRTGPRNDTKGENGGNAHNPIKPLKSSIFH